MKLALETDKTQNHENREGLSEELSDLLRDRRDKLQRIRDEGMQRSQVMQIAGWLTDIYGPRLTNSPMHRAAADWSMKTMTDAGITSFYELGTGHVLTKLLRRMAYPEPEREARRESARVLVD